MATVEPTPSRRALILEDSFVTVPVSEGAQAAIDAVVREHVDAFDAALARFGITANGVATPRYERIVWRDEVTD